MKKSKDSVKDSTKDPAPDFESALQELEKLVDQLESGELSLAESLKHFEQGVKLSKQCHALIDQARQSVEVLARVDDEDSAEPLSAPDQT